MRNSSLIDFSPHFNGHKKLFQIMAIADSQKLQPDCPWGIHFMWSSLAKSTKIVFCQQTNKNFMM